jgi:hypothetical protein
VTFDDSDEQLDRLLRNTGESVLAQLDRALHPESGHLAILRSHRPTTQQPERAPVTDRAVHDPWSLGYNLAHPAENSRVARVIAQFRGALSLLSDLRAALRTSFLAQPGGPGVCQVIEHLLLAAENGVAARAVSAESVVGSLDEAIDHLDDFVGLVDDAEMGNAEAERLLDIVLDLQEILEQLKPDVIRLFSDDAEGASLLGQ